MTDTPTDKLAEIEARHEVSAPFQGDCVGSKAMYNHAREDRAYLLSRVRELEAGSGALAKDLGRLTKLNAAIITENDRLRAILDAPVTDEVITAMHDAMVEWGVASVPSYRCLECALKAAIAARRAK